MAEDGSSGARGEPAHDDSHEGDRHEAPRGRGASRPKGDGGAKVTGKAKVRAAQGKVPARPKERNLPRTRRALGRPRPKAAITVPRARKA